MRWMSLTLTATRTGSINLEVADMRASIDRATSLIASFGGQVAESHEENEGEHQAATVTLQAIMARATTIADVLKVQQELTGIRGDIESVTAQRDNLADRAALGTLDVIFTVPVVAAAVASNGWELGREVDNAVAALVRVSQVLTSLAVWIAIVIVPVLLPVLLVIWLAVRIRRRVAANRSSGATAPL